VVFAAIAPDAAASSQRARSVFRKAAKQDVHLALMELPTALVKHGWPELAANTDTLSCLRCCLMKPEHMDWIDDICEVLERVC